MSNFVEDRTALEGKPCLVLVSPWRIDSISQDKKEHFVLFGDLWYQSSAEPRPDTDNTEYTCQTLASLPSVYQAIVPLYKGMALAGAVGFTIFAVSLFLRFIARNRYGWQR